MISKLQVVRNPSLLNQYIQENKYDYTQFKETQVSAIVKNEFKGELHSSTIDKHIDPKYKNPIAVNKAKKTKHKTSLRSRIIKKIMSASEEELYNIASGLNETWKLFDKKS